MDIQMQNVKVFFHSSREGKEYYGIAIPWRIAKLLASKTLDATLRLPDGELRIHGVEITYTGGKIAIMIPSRFSERLKGVDKVDVVLKEVE